MTSDSEQPNSHQVNLAEGGNTAPCGDKADEVRRAAQMAGEWWAKRLHPDHSDKREAFAAAVASRIEQELRGECYWAWPCEKKQGNGQPRECVSTECDYDPQGLMLEAVREVIAPDCRGSFFSARGILPQKHNLRVWLDKLEPKEGYGNWTAVIYINEARQA